MHGHFTRSLDEKLVYKEYKGETGSTMWHLRIKHSIQTALRKKI